MTKKPKTKKEMKTSSKPEKITGAEALQRMKDFPRRKEQIIANIRASKN
jgi:hypothetical protein